MRQARLFVTAIVVALAGWVSAISPAAAAAPCCAITTIDQRSAVITALDGTTRRTFQFKVNDAAQLRTLKVGQKISVDFVAGTVTLMAGQRPCCQIMAAGQPLTTPGTGIRTVTSQAPLVNPAIAAIAVNPRILLPDLVPYVAGGIAMCSWDVTQGQTCESQCPPTTLNLPFGTKNISSRPLNGALTIRLFAHPSGAPAGQWTATNVAGAGQQTPAYRTHTFVFCHPPGVVISTSPPPPTHRLVVESAASEADKNNNAELIYIKPGDPIGP